MIKKSVSLHNKFYGCLAGCHIGSAMGAAVENWSHQKIEEKYGLLKKLLPYEHYGNGWMREPGTTEDGVERQKLMLAAIMNRQDRVSAEDVRQAWLVHMNPKAAGLVSEPFEGKLLELAKSVIPAEDIGKYCDYSGLNSVARSCHPIALINAGDIPSAIKDVMDVGRLYQSAGNRGLKWAAVTAAAVAEATAKDANVNSVIKAIYDHCDPRVVEEIDRELNRTAHCKDIKEMAEVFDDIYSGQGMDYAYSYANEVVTKGVCIFKMVKGNTRDAIIAGVNMGRDTDCVAAVAGGISGALTGTGTLPEEWIKQVDYATSINEHTNSQRTMEEWAGLLYKAYQNRLKNLNSYILSMDY